MQELTYDVVTSSIFKDLTSRVVGQDQTFHKLVPDIWMAQAGLAPSNRPISSTMLLGPTGVGKTKTVEALAEVLHGHSRSFVRIDCGEFQMEHEVAKLLGAPPGYLGHRETQPMLSQARLRSVASDTCDISIVLFDEVEKAAPSLVRMLLGVLDKATLRLGDNTTVNFENSMIFFTSNLGADGMKKLLSSSFGLAGLVNAPTATTKDYDKVVMSAVRNKFSPEFINRIDHFVTYLPLNRESLTKILTLELVAYQRLLAERFGPIGLHVTHAAQQWLLDNGTSVEFGARELRRLLQRVLHKPIAANIALRVIGPHNEVTLDVVHGEFKVYLGALDVAVEVIEPAKRRKKKDAA